MRYRIGDTRAWLAGQMLGAFCTFVMCGCSEGKITESDSADVRETGLPDEPESSDPAFTDPTFPDDEMSESDGGGPAPDAPSAPETEPPSTPDDAGQGEVPAPSDAGIEVPLPVDSGSGDPSAATALVHPGVLNSASELDLMRTRVTAKQEPWASAFAALKGSKYAALSYTATPFSEVACGSYNKPNVGCTPMVEDGMAVYAHALSWYVTRNQAHANKAIQIIDAWVAKYQKNTESNARLVVAWAAPWYVNGAELLRYSNAGWSQASIDRFTGMLRKMLPYVQDDTRPENNWIQSRIEAHMAIAVFMDDRAQLAKAVERWRFWLPIYIYQSSDGAKPVNAPGRTTAETERIWRSSAASTQFVNGLAMETCRDLGHLGLGFGSMMYAAETAYQQGIDLVTPNKKRLSDFLELHGSWMTGAVKVPSTICGGVVKQAQADSTGIAPPQGGGEKAWEIAYDHLHERLGTALPFTGQMIREGRPAGGNRWVEKWETLTHAQRSL